MSNFLSTSTKQSWFNSSHLLFPIFFFDGQYLPLLFLFLFLFPRIDLFLFDRVLRDQCIYIYIYTYIYKGWYETIRIMNRDRRNVTKLVFVLSTMIRSALHLHGVKPVRVLFKCPTLIQVFPFLYYYFLLKKTSKLFNSKNTYIDFFLTY